jgi:uncharacterized protein YndB with AHSA1/START domain
MPEATHMVTIDRPIEQVFEFLANAENDQKWREGVISISHRSGSGIGAVYEQRVRGPAGRPVVADIEITAMEAPSLIDFRGIAGPVQPVGNYRLESLGSETKVTLHLSVELTGVKRIMNSAVQKSMTSETRALEGLKAHLEQDGEQLAD